MSVLMEEDFIIGTRKNKELEKQYEGIGYVAYKKGEEIKVKEIKILEILEVIDCKNGRKIETYVSFSFIKKYKKYLFLKREKEIVVENGFYSKDFYSFYDPFGMFRINEVFETKKEALKNYKKEKKQSELCDLFY